MAKASGWVSPAKYWASPEGKHRKELRKLDANAHRPVDMTPRLIKGTTNTTEESIKPVTTRTSGSNKPSCKECGAPVTGRRRNGFCSDRCRMRTNRRNQVTNQVSLEDFKTLQAQVTTLQEQLFALQKRVAKVGYYDVENGQDTARYTSSSR
jgi:hypothetical protein